MQSTRSQPEPRVELGNGTLRLDFDPRTSDTMYNYVWVRRHGSGPWERLHNFGVDVRAKARGKSPSESPEGIINTIGMCLDLHRDGNAMRVGYPAPLVQYRQFDDKIGSPELVARYPDFPLRELPQLFGSDARVEFTYTLDATRPSFTITGKILSGPVTDITYILDALWTDNHALPTHEYIEGFPEFDQRTPDATLCRMAEIQNVAYAIFYRHDGNGVPFALLPLEPTRGMFVNFYDNWKCLYDFGKASCNQAYAPQDPAVRDCTDAGYLTWPRADGTFPGVRVAFFPELSYARGGLGHELRGRIVQAIREQYCDSVRSWDRLGKWLPPKLTLSAPVTS